MLVTKAARTTLLCVLLISTATRLHASQPVTVQGTGISCEDALKQAKSQAIEQISGSFISNQRTLKNDRTLEESLNEYTAGVITTFKIIDTDHASPCKVTIQAMLDADRSLVTSAPIANRSVDLGHLGSLAQNRTEGIAILSSLVDRPDQFRVDVSKVSFTQEAGTTRVDLSIEKLTYTEQWANDLEALLSVQSEPHIYEKPSLGKALLTLFAIPITLPLAIVSAPFTNANAHNKVQNSENSICFSKDTQFNTLNCYDGPLASELIKQLSDISIRPVLKDHLGNLHPLPQQRRVSMIANYIAPIPLKRAGENERRQNFIVIGATGFPARESIRLRDRLLTPGFTLDFMVSRTSR